MLWRDVSYGIITQAYSIVDKWYTAETDADDVTACWIFKISYML